jgi:hypothetical protein
VKASGPQPLATFHRNLRIHPHAGSSVQPAVAFFLGSELSQLHWISSTETPVWSQEIVSILVDGVFGSGGDLHIDLEFLPAPSNDDYEHASRVSGVLAELAAHVLTATGESTMPSDRFTHTYRDVWWRWTAPGPGVVTITNLNPDSTPAFAVYTGDSHAERQLVAGNWQASYNASLQFQAVPRTTYFISGHWSHNGDHLNLRLQQDPSEVIIGAWTAGWLPDGRFGFNLFGPPGKSYSLEFSTNLAEWHDLADGAFTEMNGVQPPPGAGGTTVNGKTSSGPGFTSHNSTIQDLFHSSFLRAVLCQSQFVSLGINRLHAVISQIHRLRQFRQFHPAQSPP